MLEEGQLNCKLHCKYTTKITFEKYFVDVVVINFFFFAFISQVTNKDRRQS